MAVGERGGPAILPLEEVAVEIERYEGKGLLLPPPSTGALLLLQGLVDLGVNPVALQG